MAPETTDGLDSGSASPPTHPAIVTVDASSPLQLHHVATPVPTNDQVRVLVQYTTTSPLDMHQALGGLLVKPPQILGSSVAGVVIEIGAEVKRLKTGDRVFGYMFRGNEEKSYQLYVVASEKQFARVEDTRFRPLIEGEQSHGGEDGDGEAPGKGADEIDGVFSMEECVSIANNFVSAWHAITADLGLDLPWPKPAWFHRQHDTRSDPVSILIWGGGSSVGQYALQILHWYGYKDITVVASNGHHEKLREYGATRCISYTGDDIVNRLNGVQELTKSHHFSHILDCIGSLQGSIEPISKIGRSPSKVAIFLPVIIRDATADALPEYSMDVQAITTWSEGVEAAGIRTHFYTKDEYLAEHLQSRIMPAALSLRIIEPNDRILVQGSNMLERAEKAMKLLRDKQVRGAKLVWKVAEDSQLSDQTP